MNVLLIGSGGREHALAWKITQSPRLEKFYAAPGSDALSVYAEPAQLDISNHAAVTDFCKDKHIHLVVVGPEDPLAAGLADALWDAGISVFGPKKDAARLESSKSFAKDFMRRHGIPTADCAVFTDPQQALEAADAADYPLVVKADGLAAGKGVRICASKEEAQTAIKDFMQTRLHGDAGQCVVLEECLTGPECSLMGLCDGTVFLPLPLSSDHKRLQDNDLGPNTGGMGVIAPTPEVDDALMTRIQKEILTPLLAGLKKDNLQYRGVLYCGLMLTDDGPKVLEFNVRFGDPETQAVLPLICGDLLPLLEATAHGQLTSEGILTPEGLFRFPLYRGNASVCIVLASEGYPARPITGRPIKGLENNRFDDALIFHAGTQKKGDIWETTGGRVLGVTGIGTNLEEARTQAYQTLKQVHFNGMQYRTDIGKNRKKVMETIS